MKAHPCKRVLFFCHSPKKNLPPSYTDSMKTILFTGGGSAGHVVPNLAIMHEMRYSHNILYMGTGGTEKRLVTEAGYPFFEVDCPKLIRAFTLRNFTIPHRLHHAKKEALGILRRERPDLVFSKGGFVSYPAVWAAWKLGIPVLTHESDLSPGLCTRLIAKKCRRVLTSFPETAKLFPNGQYVGSPIRREIGCGERTRARKKYGFEGETPVLLVLGGGSGSHLLNQAIRGILPSLLPELRILHLCGRGGLSQENREGYVQREFETDIASAYACADFVLCRAGSNTLFELLFLKKPALLVPLSHGSRGDQLENALYFQGRGLCRILPEGEISSLLPALHALFEDVSLRDALSSCSVQNAVPAILTAIRETLSQG